MNIISLDIASITGWAISKELYGTWDLKTLKDESMGMKLIRFKSKLSELCRYNNPDLIVYERPAGKHANSIIHQSKMIAILEEYAETHDIAYKSYSAKEIKKFATGNGNASKDKMIEEAKNKYGYTGNDDNEADALHMLFLAKKELEDEK